MYLVVCELPEYPKTEPPTGAVHVTGYPNNRTLDYTRTRAFIERKYPDATIYTPLERAPQGSLILGVYLSPRRDGVGRLQCNFELWAIKR